MVKKKNLILHTFDIVMNVYRLLVGYLSKTAVYFYESHSIMTSSGTVPNENWIFKRPSGTAEPGGGGSFCSFFLKLIDIIFNFFRDKSIGEWRVDKKFRLALQIEIDH